MSKCPKCLTGQMFPDYDFFALKYEERCFQCGYTPPPKVILRELLQSEIGFRLTPGKSAKIEKELTTTRKIYTRSNEL